MSVIHDQDVLALYYIDGQLGDVGCVGIDHDASPGNGKYFVQLFDGSYDAVGFDSFDDAVCELLFVVESRGVPEGDIICRWQAE